MYALDDPQADADPPVPLLQRLRDRCADSERLSMARYMPSLFALSDDLEARQVTTAGLLESILLKRLESSAVALRNTLDKLIASHETFLRALEGGMVLSGKLLTEFGASDEDIEEFLDRTDEERLDDVEPPRRSTSTDSATGSSSTSRSCATSAGSPPRQRRSTTRRSRRCWGSSSRSQRRPSARRRTASAPAIVAR